MARHSNTWQQLIIWIALAFLTALTAAQDFYQLLNVDRNADTAAIKKAFRKMSLEYHPDKNPGDEDAAEKFTRINRAAEVLTDETKRQIYDQQGEDEVDRFERGGDNRRKGPENKFDFSVTLEELYNGVKKEFNVNRNVYCTKCKGSGAEGGKTKTCPKCNGQGVVTVIQDMGFMKMQMQQHCPTCGGKGRSNEKDCNECRGRKVTMQTKTLTLEVERGMANNEKIVYERQGEQIPDMLQGDIIVQLKQTPHNVFKRVGDNLYMNLDITLQEALFGYAKRISHLDGHQFNLISAINKVTQPFSWNIIHGQGMPIKHTHIFGELHAKIIVNFPTKLTQRQKDLVKQIFPE